MATGWAGPALAGLLVMVPCAAARAGLDDYALGNGQNGTTFVTPAANDYRLLTANATVGASSITLDSNTGVAAGQLVLLLQVRVANAGPGNSTTPFALDTNGAGQLEYARLVANTSGTIWSLDKALVRSYTSSAADARVQVVRVREYTNVTVPNVNVVTYNTPNANRGGVFALMATGSVTLTGTTVNASGDGFAGGVLNTNDATFGCTQIDSTSATQTAQKGQSVFTFATNVRARGNRGTGGGGGVCRNSGGGGGGNGSEGGKGGGSAINNDGARDVGGFGGTAATGNLLMNATFGGGGGGGHQNESAGSAGARGGGMILIRANNILGTGSFLASGANGGGATSDGAGGGGGGGTVVLRAAGTLQCSAIAANGGNGGNVSVGSGGDGGGGGGGGGRVLVQATTGPSCTATATPGLAGVANSNGDLHFATGSNSVPPISPGIVENPSPGLSFLLARLGNVEVVRATNGTTVRFSTVAEVGSAGFVVERVGGDYRLEPSFLRAAPLGFVGARYTAVDRAGEPGSYRIVEIDRDGRANLLGTFDVSRRTDGPEPPDAQLLMAMAPGPQLLPYAPAPRGTDAARARISRPATIEDTLWRVPLPALATYLSMSERKAIDLARGSELLVTIDDVSHPYTVDDTDLIVRVPGEPQPKQRPESVLFVSRGAGRLLPLATAASPDKPTRELERHRLDLDVIPALAASADADLDFWMSAYVSAESPEASAASFVVPLVDDGDDAEVEVELVPAFGPWQASAEVALEWNGVALGTFDVPLVRSTLVAPVPAAALVAGDNTLSVVALAVSDGPTGLFVNSVQVTARARAFVSSGDPARRFAVEGRAVVAGDTGVIAAVESAGDVRFVDLAGGAAAIAAPTGGTVLLATPVDEVRLSRAARAPTLADDVTSVIVTHPGLLAEAEALAGLHGAEGHKAAVVLADDLYDRFGGGHISARAVTRFLAAERARGVEVRFLTLFGRGDFSPSSWTEAALPPLLVGTDQGIFSSDVALADLDGDGAADVAVGRVPAATPEEAARYLARRALFQALPDLADQPALFISDRSSGDFHFDEDAERARTERTNAADSALVLDAVDTATARAALYGAAASSLRLLDFVGHGGMDRLGADGLITTADVAALGGSPTVIVAPTCVAARTELGSVRVIGERLLLDGDAGPVAVVSATGLVHHAEAAAFNAELIRLLSARQTATLGEVVAQAARAAGRAALVTVLLGDPTLRVAAGADADLGRGERPRTPVAADGSPSETQPDERARDTAPTNGCAAGAGGTWALALLLLAARRRRTW